MMRLLTISTIFAFILSGCAVKELNTVSGQDTYANIKVSMPSSTDTRLALGNEADGKLYQVWQKGDRIAVVEAKGTSAQKTSIYELYGNGGTSDGRFCYVSGNADIDGPVDVIYPVKAVESENIIPSFQNFVAGSYDPQAVLLSWHGDSGIPEDGITLANDMAVICLQYTGTASQKVSSVRMNIYPEPDECVEYRVVSYDGVTLSEEPSEFFISIPEFPQDCSVEFKTILTDHSVMTIRSEAKTFLAGDFYRFPPREFVADASGASSFAENLLPHPRILMPTGYEEKIRQILASGKGDFLQVIHNQIEEYSNQLLKKDPYLKTSLSNVNYPREIMGRVMYLSYMYHMTGEEKYAQRAERELLAAAAHYDEWRPDHFLTTSEMTLAFAIGYDWLYDYLSESSKETIVNEIKTKGLDLAGTSYGNKYKSSVGNWNSVCSACMTASALAIFEHDPVKYTKFVADAIEKNLKAVENFSPDGGYPEGYSYWHYGVSYQTIMFEVLKTALGYDSTLPETTAGFDKTGAFPTMMSTPSGSCFSYGDVAMDAGVSCASFWLARRFNRPDWLYLDKKMILANDFEQEDMLWRFNPIILCYSVGLDLASIAKPKENVWFAAGDQPVFAYRSGFDSSADTYLGIKGGHPKSSHAHMDSGSFYYERDGVVWADDLGSDSYTLSGYWSNGQTGARWNIFRLGVSGHSTISFDGGNHIVTASAPITNYFSDDMIGATVDLTAACSDKVSKAERTIYLDGDVLNVIDEVIPLKNTTITWNMITTAEAEIDGSGTILLSSGDKKMSLNVLAPADAELFILPAEGEEGNLPNPNHLRVGFKANLPLGEIDRLHVKLIPII